MKRLRKQTRIDVLDAQKRSSSGKLGRMIYLGLVFVFLGSLAYYLIGNMFVLSIDGTVLKERYLVSANYPGKVTEVLSRKVMKCKPVRSLRALSHSR